jgi:hypothetical protein
VGPFLCFMLCCAGFSSERLAWAASSSNMSSPFHATHVMHLCELACAEQSCVCGGGTCARHAGTTRSTTPPTGVAPSGSTSTTSLYAPSSTTAALMAPTGRQQPPRTSSCAATCSGTWSRSTRVQRCRWGAKGLPSLYWLDCTADTDCFRAVLSGGGLHDVEAQS